MKIKDAFYGKYDELKPDDIPVEWWLERFRLWRAEELKNSDWTQLPDASVDSSKWAIYRQTLRDLPSLKDFANVELPARPK